MIYHKLARVLGIFVDVQDKFKHAMEIYSIFLQAMEKMNAALVEPFKMRLVRHSNVSRGL